MTYSGRWFFVCAMGLLSCAVQEPEAGADAGAGAGGESAQGGAGGAEDGGGSSGARTGTGGDGVQGGAGNAGDGGGSGGPPLARCGDVRLPDVYGFFACSPATEDSMGQLPTEFTVVATDVPCDAVGYLEGSPYPQPGVAWEIEADSGERWNVGFFIEGVESSLLEVGDRITVTRDFVPGVTSNIDANKSRGYVAIEKDGMPVVFLAFSVLPEFQALPDFAVEPGEKECEVDECWSRKTMRVTAGGNSVSIERGGTAALAGMTLRSGGLQDTSNCDRSELISSFLPADYMLAGYRTPE